MWAGFEQRKKHVQKRQENVNQTNTTHMEKFASETSIHGISEIVFAKNLCLRMIFVLIFLTALTITVYEIEQTVEMYLQQPIATKVSYEALSPQDASSLIQFLLCPTEWMSKTKVSKLGLSEDDVKALLSLTDPLVAEERNWTTVTSEKIEKLQTNAVVELIEQIIKDYPFRQGAPLHILPASGIICFLRGKLEIFVTPDGGVGFMQVLDLLENDSVPLQASLTKMRLRLQHYAGPLVFSLWKEKLLNIKKDTAKYVYALKATRFEHVKDCETISKEQYYPPNHAQQVCTYECLRTVLFETRLNCTQLLNKAALQVVASHRKVREDLEPCSYNKIYTEDYNKDNKLMIEDYLDNPGIKQAVIDCSKDYECGKKKFCTEWDFTIVPERSLLREELSVDEMHLFMVVPNYVEVIEEILIMTWETFVSNIGGQAGLWLGASILSFVQIVHFIGNAIIARIKRDKQEDPTDMFRNNITSNTNDNENKGFDNDNGNFSMY